MTDKAEAFLKVVNPPGQHAKAVAATDKELPHVIETLIEIYTLFTIQQSQMFEETKNAKKDQVPHINELKNLFKYATSTRKEQHDYLRRGIVQMRMSEIEDPQHLSGLLWLIFGHESKLDL